MLRLRGSSRADWKPDRLCDISTKSIVTLLTEDREPTSPLSGNQRLRYYRQVYPRLVFVSSYSPQKAYKKIFRCPITLFSLAFSFSDCFVEFVSVFESCCWFRSYRHRSATAPSLLFVSAAIPSTFPRLQVEPPHYSICPR